MVLSPIILVRLLTVEQFGAYREFLLYAAVMSSLAAFNININLLYFVPSRPESTWRFVNQSTILVGGASLVIVGVTVVLDLVTGGAVVGRFLLPVALFTLCFVNIDFWEQLWLAQKQATAVWIYTAVRLIARMLVAVLAAALTADVEVIVWSLVALEVVRLIASAIAWRVARQDPGPSWAGSWREQ